MEVGGVFNPDAILSRSLLTCMKTLEVVRSEVWEQLKEAYRPGDLSMPHQFQVGDAVLVRQHWIGNLEPHWKGPYQVLLTTPTAIKVEGISAWIHASHVKQAPEPSKDEWRLEKTMDPLKLRLCHRHPSSKG